MPVEECDTQIVTICGTGCLCVSVGIEVMCMSVYVSRYVSGYVSRDVSQCLHVSLCICICMCLRMHN